MSDAPVFLTPAETCDLLRISRAWLNKLVSDGSFPQPTRIGKPPGGHLRFKRSDIYAWVEQNKQNASELSKVEG